MVSSWHRFHSPARPTGRLIARLCREINAEHAAREAATPAPAADPTPDPYLAWLERNLDTLDRLMPATQARLPFDPQE